MVPSILPDASQAIIARVAQALADRSAALLVRHPLIDPRFPKTSELDLLAIADIEEFRSERLQVSAPDRTSRMVDVAHQSVTISTAYCLKALRLG